MVICLECSVDLHMAQLMPLPLTVSCFSKIQIGFTFLVPAHLGSLGKRAVKRVCVSAWYVTGAGRRSPKQKFTHTHTHTSSKKQCSVQTNRPASCSHSRSIEDASPVFDRSSLLLDSLAASNGATNTTLTFYKYNGGTQTG